MTEDTFLGPDGWQVTELDFNKDPASGAAWPTLFKGFTVTYEADVFAMCACGCDENPNDGTKFFPDVFNDPYKDFFVAYQIGSAPVDYPSLIPSSVENAIGKLAATALKINIPFAVADSDFNNIMQKIQGGVPTSTDAGTWVGGKDPCGN